MSETTDNSPGNDANFDDLDILPESVKALNHKQRATVACPIAQTQSRRATPGQRNSSRNTGRLLLSWTHWSRAYSWGFLMIASQII